MKKVKTRKTRMEDKDINLRWIVCIINTMKEDVQWVVGPSTYINKASLSFVAKAWWTLVCHWLIPTMGDNILSPERLL